MNEEARPWNARKILTDLCEKDRRIEVLTAFWKNGDQQTRAVTASLLATALRFRQESIRKASPAKKAELLASRMTQPELEEALEVALMVYHTTKAKALMSSLLDHWEIPHVEGSIEADDYKAPSLQQVRDAVSAVRDEFPQADIVLYLATAGLLMGASQPPWREATWPVVDELVG
ncbi:MAG TPA: hypothetical protein VNM92_12270 [Thermoanaerobaculia bacterium]|nr:hypothetical protein [Thermoanaerobaculia bacterium]